LVAYDGQRYDISEGGGGGVEEETRCPSGGQRRAGHVLTDDDNNNTQNAYGDSYPSWRLCPLRRGVVRRQLFGRRARRTRTFTALSFGRRTRTIGTRESRRPSLCSASDVFTDRVERVDGDTNARRTRDARKPCTRTRTVYVVVVSWFFLSRLSVARPAAPHRRPAPHCRRRRRRVPNVYQRRVPAVRSVRVAFLFCFRSFISRRTIRWFQVLDLARTSLIRSVLYAGEARPSSRFLSSLLERAEQDERQNPCEIVDTEFARFFIFVIIPEHSTFLPVVVVPSLWYRRNERFRGIRSSYAQFGVKYSGLNISFFSLFMFQ